MVRGLILLTLFVACAGAQMREASILDLKHTSKVFGEERNFRVFLPPDYEKTNKRYPVIYFFHGWSERFNKGPRDGSGYDSGDQYGGDNIARFVGANDVIVVKWDGYNPRTPGEDYLRPYNISPVETHRQFPLYFPELVKHIDATFRTIPDREHRATAGLSMGGFTSFWVAGKHPHLVGSASNFMGSSEFYVGPNGFPSEYRHTEMYRNYEGMRTRIVTGTRDFIRWYHRRMNAVWDFVRPHHEHEEFEFDHGTPGMAKTLRFHMNAFANPLPPPKLWHHIDVYPVFDVWGYAVETDRARPGFTAIENVSSAGFRSSVREWLPDGRLMPFVNVRVSTGEVYEAGRIYRVSDVNLRAGAVRQSRLRADGKGRLHLNLDGDLHEVGIAGEDTPLLSVAAWQVVGAPWIVNGRNARLRLSIVNKGSAEAASVNVTVSSPNPNVRIHPATLTLGKLPPGEVRQAQGDIGLVVESRDREMVQLRVRLNDTEVPIEVPTFANAEEIREFLVTDGGTNPIWERAIRRADKSLGTGNGDGKAQAGETVVIAVRDGEAFRPVEVLAAGACADLKVRISDSWGAYDHVGATAKFTPILLPAGCREGDRLPVFVRYQIPHKPDHILREGVVYLPVAKGDRTAPEVVWAGIQPWNRLEVELRDGARIRKAAATLTRDHSVLEVALNDEGLGGDRTPADGVFTGLVSSAPAGTYALSVRVEDELGNTASRAVAGAFPIELPRR